MLSTQGPSVVWNERSNTGSEGNDIGTKSYKLVVFEISILRIVLNYKATCAEYKKCIMHMCVCVRKKVRKKLPIIFLLSGNDL